MQKSINPPYAPVNDFTAIVALNEGGTGANNVADAVVAFGGLLPSDLNQANGAAAFNSSGGFDTGILSEIVINYPTLNGPKDIYVNSINNYTITNYDSNKTYNVSASVGSISRNGNTVTYTAPSTAQSGTITVADRVINITIQAHRPNAPTHSASLSPGATNCELNLAGTAYSVSGGSATHSSSDWEVAVDTDFVGKVFSVYSDTTNKVSRIASGLALNYTYYSRVRYRDNLGNVSAWSNTVTTVVGSDFLPSSEEAILLASDRAATDLFGYSVCIDSTGTRVAVGAVQADPDTISGAGAVYVFVRTGGSWTQEQKLIAGDKTSNDFFGSCLAFDADANRIVIGAYSADYSVTIAPGAIYIFTRNVSTWSFEQKISGSNVANGDFTGLHCDMDLNGVRIVASAYNHDTGATNAGSVYVFVRSGTTWTQEAFLQASVRTASDNFGTGVAFDDTATRLVVGCQNNDTTTTNAGSAYIFRRSVSTWTQEAMVQASDRAMNDTFGVSVDIDSNGLRIVVGCIGTDISAVTGVGSAYIFSRSGTTWTQESKLIASDRMSSDGLGAAVAINSSGNIVTVTAPNADVNPIFDCGATYVYTRVSTTWSQNNKLLASNKAGSDFMGTTNGVALSRYSSRMIVAARTSDPGGVNSAGSVYIFA